VRCPYCRQIMADTASRCVRCGAVDQGGRWVRRGTPPGDAPPRARVDPVGTPVERPAPVSSPGDARRPGPAGAPARTTSSSGRGCTIAAFAIVVVVLLALAGGILALVAATRDEGRGTAGPPATGNASGAWSLEAEGRFEAACRSTGPDADNCRCVRVELEKRFSESQVDAMVAVLERGDPLSATVQQQLRTAEQACAAG